MASKNVEMLRAAHESWNKRDFPGIVKNAAEGLVYITNPEYIDAGDMSSPDSPWSAQTTGHSVQ